MKKLLFMSLMALATASLFFVACNKEDVQEQVGKATGKPTAQVGDGMVTERGPGCSACLATVNFVSGGATNLLACGMNIDNGAVPSACNSTAPACLYGGGSATGNSEASVYLYDATSPWEFCAGDGAEDFKIANLGPNSVTISLSFGGGAQNITIPVGRAAHIRKSDACTLLTPVCVN